MVPGPNAVCVLVGYGTQKKGQLVVPGNCVFGTAGAAILRDPVVGAARNNSIARRAPVAGAVSMGVGRGAAPPLAMPATCYCLPRGPLGGAVR